MRGPLLAVACSGLFGICPASDSTRPTRPCVPDSFISRGSRTSAAPLRVFGRAANCGTQYAGTLRAFAAGIRRESLKILLIGCCVNVAQDKRLELAISIHQ